MAISPEEQEGFGVEYFEAGVLRRSRPLTRSYYDRAVYGPLHRRYPQLRRDAPRRALEIGCGFGYAAELLADRGYSVVATDISEHAIERARADVRHPAVEFESWDATRPAPFEGGFDLVAAFEVVEHLEDPGAAIATWRQLLAPGGVLVLTTPNRISPASRHRRDPTHVSVQGPQGWRRTVAGAGPWSEVRVDALQWVPYTWHLDGVMRVVPLPLLGASLRIAAVRDAQLR
jgi:SAM-dependent methyltransferase